MDAPTSSIILRSQQYSRLTQSAFRQSVFLRQWNDLCGIIRPSVTPLRHSTPSSIVLGPARLKG